MTTTVPIRLIILCAVVAAVIFAIDLMIPLGIADGDYIKITSPLGEIETTAKVTENAVPGVIALSSHGARWEYEGTLLRRRHLFPSILIRRTRNSNGGITKAVIPTGSSITHPNP